MDIGTTQGLIGVACGLLLFALGYYKGRLSGVKFALQQLFDDRILDIDMETGRIIAGPELDRE